MQEKVRKIIRGNFFEDFEVGKKFYHHWGRTLYIQESILFSTLTLNFNPIYFNKEYAKKCGYKDIPINHYFVFNVVLGLTVEDLSEQALALLGYTDVKFKKDVYNGDTIFAVSEVIEKRESKSRPDAGIVTFKTKAYNQKGEEILEYIRTNLIKKRPINNKEDDKNKENNYDIGGEG